MGSSKSLQGIDTPSQDTNNQLITRATAEDIAVMRSLCIQLCADGLITPQQRDTMIIRLSNRQKGELL